MKDTLKHQGRRNILAEKLMQKGISDVKVLDAIRKIPRHLFLDSAFEEHAYDDRAFPIGADQTISHPYTVAAQTQLLQVEPFEKVLEIGTGSGYQTAVLIELKAMVYTIERQKELFDRSKRLLPQLDYAPKYMTFGDGYKGLPTLAPFDKIIVTAGAPYLPNDLLAQLSIGGRMIIPVGDSVQTMTVIVRTGENTFEKEELGDFRFVPMLNRRN